MADEKDEGASKGKAKIALPDGREVSIKAARRVMAELTEEAASLHDDESTGSKTRRVEIARHLRRMQAAIDAMDEIVEVTVPPDASKQFPFRIGPREFWPGTHKVRGQVAMTLRYMMDQHRQVEQHIHISGGNVDPSATGPTAYGKELPSIGGGG